jgi:sugar phosphate isomerase/epimerase
VGSRTPNWPALELAATLEPLTEAGDVRSAMERLAAAGVRHVQLSATQPGLRPRELDRSARRDLLATLRRREMMISGIDLWIPPGHFLDPGQVDRAVSACQQAIEMAGDCEKCPVSLSLPRKTHNDPAKAPSPNDGFGFAPSEVTIDSVITALAAHADRYGVQLADHALPIELHEGMGIGIDPAAWLAQALDPVNGATSHAHRLVSARLCDLLTSGMRGPVGLQHESKLDVLAYQSALAVVGYRRPVVIDVRQWIDPWNGLQKTIETWSRLTDIPGRFRVG